MKVIPDVVHTELDLYVSIIINILNLIISDEGYSWCRVHWIKSLR